ncbi:hypothetical protein [Bacteroides pyogenes]|uniref:hypothetical protein n=1 Tax=Bacteroides pyogenes TaxID=310300 RepID=UPI002A91CA1D|nr:hypothetical protein [Bacteroides pyogenes]MDY5432652.1 hypothetical protein [Bacteroides pyogenes]
MNVENKTKIHSLPDYETIVSSISSYRITVPGTIASSATEPWHHRSQAIAHCSRNHRLTDDGAIAGALRGSFPLRILHNLPFLL